MSQTLPNHQFNTETKSDSLSEILQPVFPSLTSVNELLCEEMHSCNGLLSDRLACSGLTSGKRLRPALLLLAGACFADLKKAHIVSAAAIELVHAATLLHDDVLDDADQRRHVPSLNSRWDNTTSILTGDFLFSKAFEVGCRSGSLDVMRRIADSSCRVCEGEISQNAMSGNLEITERQYIEMISLKTADLCKCACGLGAVLSDCDDLMLTAFEKFGNDLGVAFQIIDDVLDLVGKPDRVGKTLGTDLANKKATLPLIHCLQVLSPANRQLLINQINNSEWKLPEIIEQFEETRSIEYSRVMARNFANEAYEFARSLPDSEYSKSLSQLAEFVIARTY